MYRCFACATRIGWLPAALSSVASPIRCEACAAEQHRRQPLLPSLGFYVALMLAAVLLVVVQAQFPRHLLVDLALLLPLLAVVVAWETFLFRRGEMVATARWSKRLAQAVMYLFFAGLVAAFAFVLYQAGGG